MQPIHFAAAGGNVDIIDALVTDYKVDPNTKVSYVATYLRTYIHMYAYVCALYLYDIYMYAL